MKEKFIILFKKIFGIRARNSLKVFIFKHPYLLGRESFFKKDLYQKELGAILEKHQNTKGIIIYPSISDWNMPLTQRFQHLATALANSGYLFFYGTHNLRYDKIEGFKKIGKNLYLTNQLEVLKDIRNPILYITWAANGFYARKYKHSKLIYDYVDDLEMFPLLGGKIYKYHEDLIKKADLVLVTANRLYNKIKDRRKDAILSPNAVNFDIFQVKNPKIPTVLKSVVAAKKPIIAYSGSLIKNCFDYDLLKYAAVKRPNYNFALNGPCDFDQSSKEHNWQNYPNIFFLGTQKKYEDLANCFYFFDVCIVPFKLNKVTQSISPLKLFEYMAAGKPIVTTDMRECKKYQSVLAAKGKEEFVRFLDKALKLKNDSQYKKILLGEAKENTWEARALDIIKALGN